MTIVYIVEMLRYGRRGSHSYISGIYSDRVVAECEAKMHIIMRAHKYCAEIREEIVDNVASGKVICYIDEVYEEEESLEDDLKSRKDWLNYKSKLQKPIDVSKVTKEELKGLPDE